jgi:aerobic carbon-monoxide dehydrogenase medium subunit
MKAAPFEYHLPETVDDALELLSVGPDIRVLAGGQSLVPLLKLRTVKPTALVDINGLPGLDGITEESGGLRIGALTRQQALVDSPLARAAHPLLCDAARHAGYLATRHRGTVGGSLAFAAPWAELTAATVVLDARIEARSSRGTRTLSAREFFRGPNETALEPEELLTAVHVPAAAPRTGSGFHEVSPRYRDFAVVAAAATVTLDEDGHCTAAELVLLRVGPTPYRADVSHLVGTTVDDDALESLADSLADVDPPSDVEASGDHRRRVALTLARRAVRDAAAKAREAA